MMKSYTGIRLYGPGHVVAYNYVADFHDGIDTEMYGMPDGSTSDRRTDLSAARVLGSPADRDRHLQQLHHQRARQLDRDGRQHAQHPRDAEHADQLGVAPDEHAAVGRRTDLLDPQHRLSRAGRIDAADQRARRACSSTTTPSSRETSARLGAERALAQQPDAAAERAAGDLQREHQHQLQLVGLQRVRSEAWRTAGVPVEFAAVGRVPRCTRARPTQPEARAAQVRDARPTTQRDTKQDQHSVIVDYDVFVNVPKLDAKDMLTVQKLYKASDFDFRLKPGSAAVDRAS